MSENFLANQQYHTTDQEEEKGGRLKITFAPTSGFEVAVLCIKYKGRKYSLIRHCLLAQKNTKDKTFLMRTRSLLSGQSAA